ncbi:MAG: hypothetical protein ACRDFS_11725 [Chloroflexota bacterium]
MSIAVSVDDSNYQAIITAIQTIALETAGLGLTTAASKLYEMPLPAEIDAAGYPFLVVRWGDNANPGGFVNREPGVTEPWWRFDCFIIYPHDPSHPNYAVAADALVKIVTQFTAEYDLTATCAQAFVIDPHLTYLRMSGAEYFAVAWTIEAREALNVQYE